MNVPLALVSDAAEPVDAAVSEPLKRFRGRPKGSKNHASKDVRAMLQEKGAAGLMALCRFAAGMPIYCRDIDKNTGRRRVIVPSSADVVAAAKVLAAKLVPDLKSQELSGPGGMPLSPVTVTMSLEDMALADGVAPERRLAMSLLSLLSTARAQASQDGDTAALAAMDAKLAAVRGLAGEPSPPNTRDDTVTRADRPGLLWPPNIPTPAAPRPAPEPDIVELPVGRAGATARRFEDRGRTRWELLGPNLQRLEILNTLDEAKARAGVLAERGLI